MSQSDAPDSAAALPPLPAEAMAGLQAAQDHGRTRLADTDEAELAAIGAPPLPRAGAAHWSPGRDEVAGAAQRLVARGLAETHPWAGGAACPAGALLTYLHLAFHPKARIGMVGSHVDPEPVPATRLQWRVNVLIDVVRGGLACVERVLVPIPPPAEPLTVTVEVVRLDQLVDDIVAAAFADVGSSVPVPNVPSVPNLRSTTVLFADGRRTPTPSRLDVTLADGTAVLEAPRQAVLGSRRSRTPVDREGFADHLRLRLMAAG